MSTAVQPGTRPGASNRTPGWRDPLAAGLFALALVYVLAIYVFHLQHSICPEFLEHGSSARNLLRTHVLRSTFLYPGEAAFLHEHSHTYDQGWPITVRSRFFVALTAVSMLIFGQNDFAVFFPCGISFVLCVPLVYLLGRDVFSRFVGAFAALFFLFTPNWIYVIEGAFRDCTFTLVILFQYRYLFNTLFAGRADSRDAAVIGATSGIAWLTRPDLLFMLPLYFAAFYVCCPGARLKRITAFTLGFAVAVLPLYAYCRANHEPVSLPYVQALVDKVVVLGPEHPLDRYQMYRPGDIFPERVGKLISKWPDLFFREYIHEWFNDSGSIWITACFVAGLFTRYTTAQARLLWFGVGQLVLHLGTTCFILYSGADGGRYYIWFSALALVYGVNHLATGAGWLGPRRVAAIMCLFLTFDVVAEAYEFALYFHARANGTRQTYYPLFWATGKLDENNDALSRLIPPGSLVMAHRGQEVAWYVDRPAVGLPWRVADIEPLVQKEPIDFVYLPPVHRAFRGRDLSHDPEFNEIKDRLGLALVKRFPDGAILYAIPSRQSPGPPAAPD